MKHPRAETIDLSAESAITIQPDGRIYAFGITRQLVEVLAAIPTGDERIRRLLAAPSGPHEGAGGTVTDIKGGTHDG
jgi:hypothetical protein